MPTVQLGTRYSLCCCRSFLRRRSRGFFALCGGLCAHFLFRVAQLLNFLQALLFLIDADERLTAAIPLARLFVASGGARLKDLAAETLIQVPVDERQDRVTELFDKYNLLTLPVVDRDGRLTGVVTADDIISVLRHK